MISFCRRQVLNANVVFFRCVFCQICIGEDDCFPLTDLVDKAETGKFSTRQNQCEVVLTFCVTLQGAITVCGNIQLPAYNLVYTNLTAIDNCIHFWEDCECIGCEDGYQLVNGICNDFNNNPIP